MEEKLRKNKALVSIAAVCVVLGMMMSMQFKSTDHYDFVPYRSSRVEDLTMKLQSVTEENDRLIAQNIELQEKLTNARNENAAMMDMQNDLDQAEMAAGFTTVRGPGIILTLNDSQRALQAGDDPNYLLVHDDDLLRITNELKASGAEAISINNERLITTSEIRCVGTTILVNTKKISPPFVIAATGDPQNLEKGITMRGGYLEALKFSGIQIQLQKVDQIEIPAYLGPFKYNFTTLAEKN